MSRPTAFAHWLARQPWREPEAMLERFANELSLAAKSVGANFTGVQAVFDGKRHYLPNDSGEIDSKQYYVASLDKHKDGTLWPEFTFGSFKASVDNRYWSPRDAAWREFESDKRGDRLVQDADALKQYRDAVAEAAKRADQLRRERDQLTVEAHEAARIAAVSIFRDGVRKFSEGETHPYLDGKGLLPTTGVRIASSDTVSRVYSSRHCEWKDHAIVARTGELLIPMIEAVPDGKVWGVQRINKDGKFFLSGQRKAGLYHRIAGSNDVLLVCEGYADGVTLNSALGYTVLVAFDCGNLDSVVNFALGEAAGKPVIVAADNDWETALKPQMRGKNPGLEQAQNIERHMSVPFMAPKFDAAKDVGRKDWDDVRRRDGLEASQATMKDALRMALRRWAGLPVNDSSKLPVNIQLQAPALAPAPLPTEPASSPMPAAPAPAPGTATPPPSPSITHAAQAQEAELAVLERLTVNTPRPAHWKSREMVETVFPEHFPHPNDKCTAPLDTRENLEYLMEVYGITCRYNQISKDNEILIPGLSFSRDNRANATIAELTSLCKRCKMPTQNIDQYVLSIADRHSYNPILNWINGTPWDGKDRMRALLDTIKVSSNYDADMRDLLVSKWLLSAVAAAVRPSGFYSKGVLVFRGAQSRGKTTWFKNLVPRSLVQYIKDGLHLDPTNKDTVFTATAHWIVELGELDATFRKSDIASLKAFIPKEEDRLRRPFDRKDSMLPRRTVFFASVNDKQFLIDDTGNTRWWTVEVESLDHSHDIDMQQLYAQLYQTMYMRGAEWWLLPHEESMLNATNAEYEVADPIEERIVTVYDFIVKYDETGNRKYEFGPKHKLQATEILLRLGFDKPDKKLTIAVGKALNRMGLTPKRSNKGSVYEMPDIRIMRVPEGPDLSGQYSRFDQSGYQSGGGYHPDAGGH